MSAIRFKVKNVLNKKITKKVEKTKFKVWGTGERNY